MVRRAAGLALLALVLGCRTQSEPDSAPTRSDAAAESPESESGSKEEAFWTSEAKLRD